VSVVLFSKLDEIFFIHLPDGMKREEEAIEAITMIITEVILLLPLVI